MNTVVQLMLQSGWVAWTLVAVCWIMWSLVGLRAFSLGLGEAATQRVTQAFATALQKTPPKMWSWLTLRYTEKLQRHRFGLRVVIAVAPLLGLLGTVSGMVEMFVALAGAGGTEESSVARGISTALFTTQLGLVISVPGLIAARLLERRELRLTAAISRTHHDLRQGVSS